MSSAIQTGRLVVVANRLPVAQVPDDEQDRRGRWETSPGGLVSALAPILREREGSWVGWPGDEGPPLEPFAHEGIRLRPVGLTTEELESFYLGFANSTLWPLYHDAVRWPEFHRRWWGPYVEVNQRFARRTAEIVGPDDVVWVHDYHLQLVPMLLRREQPRATIGFFLHIPFPPVELFAQIPWRTHLLEGLLGADLVGFQTKNGARNFSEAARRFTSAQGAGGVLEFEGRRVRVDSFPISIDVERYTRLASTPAVVERSRQIRSMLGPERTVYLGVDRLDYTKGIVHRLRAFETFLEHLGEASDSVVFVQVAVPSRELVPEYMEVRTRIEHLVGRINGSWSRPGAARLHYMYRSLSTDELVAHYLAADAMVVTPLRDGMNLVAKEYVASRASEDGVLILSEFTGAAHELKKALLVNPHDIDGMANAFEEARTIDPAERRRRMISLRRAVRRHDVHDWADAFLGALVR